MNRLSGSVAAQSKRPGTDPATRSPTWGELCAPPTDPPGMRGRSGASFHAPPCSLPAGPADLGRPPMAALSRRRPDRRGRLRQPKSVDCARAGSASTAPLLCPDMSHRSSPAGTAPPAGLRRAQVPHEEQPPHRTVHVNRAPSLVRYHRCQVEREAKGIVQAKGRLPGDHAPRRGHHCGTPKPAARSISPSRHRSTPAADPNVRGRPSANTATTDRCAGIRGRAPVCPRTRPALFA